jgi:RNA polymerase sigma-70 factor, ECF subfamily
MSELLSSVGRAVCACNVEGVAGHYLGMSARDRFELIYGRHAPTVKAYVMRRAPAAIADDVVADVFTVCWRRLEDVPADPLPWLIGVAARVLRTHRRGEDRRVRLGHRLAGAEPTALTQAPAGGDATLGAALQQMRDTDRELLLLIAWEGLSPTQAAAVLGIAPVTVRVRLHRARTRLRIALAQSNTEAESRSELSMEAAP